MTSTPYHEHLRVARKAAFTAGKILTEYQKKQNSLVVQEIKAHDIKLELDRKLQDLIVKSLLDFTPQASIYGEEDTFGNQEAPECWIIDPIDGTVNFFFGIPHYCISIAFAVERTIMVGVIYDPIRDELWQAERGITVTLNNQPIQVSNRSQLQQATVSVGLFKEGAGVQRNLPQFNKIAQQALKCRLMGSAALDMAYLATGRLDVFIESEIHLWDIAAGILMVEMAGGILDYHPHPKAPEKYSMIASNGNIDLPSLEELYPSLTSQENIPASSSKENHS